MLYSETVVSIHAQVGHKKFMKKTEGRNKLWRDLLLKQQTFRMRIGPLGGEEKHLSCTLPLLTA